ncbi:MAG: DMT family transporter [Anaerolineaceae bacterium]|nr:DMT family transporter [Anaerolineaceae bacterium]
MTTKALILALLTIFLWSFLAFLGAALVHLPPILIVAITLTISGLVSMLKVRTWKVPWTTLIIGIGGLFGYHFLFFSAFKYAPAVEANLLNYLWPLLIVLLTPLYLPGYTLQKHHIVGAILGLMGAGLIVSGGKIDLDMKNLSGYLMAAGAAFVCASYSLLTKRVKPFSTGAVGGFCLSSGVLAFGIFLVQGGRLEIFSIISMRDWLFLVLMGMGPLGAAFFTWDAALKRGDPRIIGSLTYLTPMLSTLNLVLLGGKSLNWISASAMLLIIAGALIGSLDIIYQKNFEST